MYRTLITKTMKALTKPLFAATYTQVIMVCPKISYSKVADKMSYENSRDPDQTAPEGAVRSGSILFANPLSFKKQQHKKQNLGQIVWNKVLKILGHLPYNYIYIYNTNAQNFDTLMRKKKWKSKDPGFH